MTKFEDNLSPYVTLVEQGSAPANPSAGNQKLYMKTSDHLLYRVNSSGTVTAVGGGSSGVATDAIWTTSGKVAVATGTATATEQWPPAHEFDYVQITSPVTPGVVAEGSATTIITGNSVTYDGSTVVMIEFYSPTARADLSTGASMFVYLFDGSTSLGRIARRYQPGSTDTDTALYAVRRLTPSNAAHTYSIRAISSTSSGGGATIGAGAGGTGTDVPAFMRIFKA